MAQWSSLLSPGRKASGVHSVYSFFFFFFKKNMGINFAISLLFFFFFSTLFISDGWLCYPDRGFASQMFLQIKGT